MSEILTYIGDVMGAPRMVRSDKWKQRPIVQRYWAYRDMLRLAAKKQKFELDGYHMMQFKIKMPKSWSKKKKDEMRHTPHLQRPDIDNLQKGVYDALLQEDSGIWYVEVMKVWGDESEIKIRNKLIK